MLNGCLYTTTGVSSVLYIFFHLHKQEKKSAKFNLSNCLDHYYLLRRPGDSWFWVAFEGAHDRCILTAHRINRVLAVETGLI